MTDVCKMVNEVSPSTDIILCEIPPREQSLKKWRVPTPKLKMMQEWIVRGNNILRAISWCYPYVKFLSTSLV